MTMSALLGAISSRIAQSIRILPGTLWSRVGTNVTALSAVTNHSTTWSYQLSQLQHQPKRFGHAFPQFVSLPAVHRLAGQGDVYQTKVDRKRIIKDPNEPNFEHIEPLKWTTWRMLRDVRRRHIFTRYYLNRSCLYNMRKSKLLPNSIREVAFDEEVFRLPRDSRFHHLRNRCAITGRSRGNLKKYRLSRLCWRNLADYNKLSGVIKASW